jgi:hypothetical protein
VALEEQEELQSEAACQKKQVDDLEATRRKNEKSFCPQRSCVEVRQFLASFRDWKMRRLKS